MIVLMFFFASAGASAAYLTVSEIFPMETRALAIALFFAVGTGSAGSSARCCSASSSPPATPSDRLLHRRRADGARRDRRDRLRGQGRAPRLEDIAKPLTAVQSDVTHARTATA